VFRHWAVDKIEGLNAAAEQAREDLMKNIDRIGKVARRQIERRGAIAAV